MYRYVHESRTTVAPETLWSAKKDLARWPEFDAGLESVTPKGPFQRGTEFTLRPQGGPNVRMTIESAEAPRRFADVAHLFLAKMRTATEFTKTNGDTVVRVTIEVFGPLAFFWNLVLARKLAAESAAQTQAFIRYAGRAA
ncbi:MAG TPA: SRPBCC family protein [bacterium]